MDSSSNISPSYSSMVLIPRSRVFFRLSEASSADKSKSA
jgi:hypothetical protein